MRRPPRSLPAALALALALAAAAPPAAAAENAGAYLAARTAIRAADFREAAAFFTRALVRAPSDPTLLDGALAAQVGQGAIPAAVPVARRLHAMGRRSLAIDSVVLADKAARGDWARLRDALGAGAGIGALPDALLSGWAQVGEGRMTDALATFDRLAATPGPGPGGAYARYHRALALALAGDYEGADAALAADARGFAGTRRGAIAHAQILAQLDRFDAAAAVLDAAFGAEPDAEVTPLRAALAARAAPPFDAVTSARDGAAEVFHSLGLALPDDTGEEQRLLYARLAQFLRPDLAEAHLVAGAILAQLDQFALATEAYRLVPPTHPAFLHAELARARALAADRRRDEALAVLRALAAAQPGYLDVHMALGGELRRARAFAEAAAAYDLAAALVRDPEPRHWLLFHVRGIAHERAGNWDAAEADFRRALALNPDEPEVLNYLGYSLLELNRNIPEALALIERALALAPDAGHIVDSYAWGLFLTGRFDAAVEPMERASLLLPLDPVVTDHLGDVYWAVGRRTEARFQWRRALSFEPEPDLALRIRRKLEVGLDAVLAEEGATPLDARRR